METVKTRVHFLNMETRRHPPRVQDGGDCATRLFMCGACGLRKLRLWKEDNSGSAILWRPFYATVWSTGSTVVLRDASMLIHSFVFFQVTESHGLTDGAHLLVSS